MGMEKRKHPRIETNLFLRIDHPAFPDGLSRGVAVDVSLSGLAFETEAELPQNEELICQVEIPFRFKGRVVRRVGEGQMKKYGVKFDGLGFWDRLLLKRALRNRPRTGKV